MQDFFPFVGVWFWWIAAGILLFMELLAPGVFLMWLAFARPWYSKGNLQNSDQPNLNQRIYAFVGKSFVLSEPIINGQGKLDIEGTRWDVLGPDLARGATVKVTAVEGMKLRVTEA
jgi:membrane protein implicated in regulation of membrane protease activity